MSRDKLIARHSRYVHYLVQRVRDGLTVEEIEDVTSEGMLGMVETANRFDEKQFPPEMFISFARYRIRQQSIAPPPRSAARKRTASMPATVSSPTAGRRTARTV